jgi:hypothetical protein
MTPFTERRVAVGTQPLQDFCKPQKDFVIDSKQRPKNRPLGSFAYSPKSLSWQTGSAGKFYIRKSEDSPDKVVKMVSIRISFAGTLPG